MRFKYKQRISNIKYIKEKIDKASIWQNKQIIKIKINNTTNPAWIKNIAIIP